MGALVLFSVLIVTMIIGLPVSWCLLLSSFCAAMTANMKLVMLAQRIFAGGNSYTMLAVPAFMVAGDIMSRGGIAKRLVNLADSLLGRIHGGLAIVSIASCAFFAALTGAATATTAAVGGIMYPEMIKRKYPEDFSAAVQAIGGTLGPVIPPSLMALYYAQSTSTSIPQLLLAGVIPGLLSALALAVTAYTIARIKRIPKVEGRFSFKTFISNLWASIPALLCPIIILGGIYSGVFTATESAAVAVVYAFLVSIFVTREMKIKEVIPVLRGTAASTANMTILVMSAMTFGYLVEYFNIPTTVGNYIKGISDSPIVFLIIVVLILFVAGMFMQGAAVIMILAPILHPVAVSFGINPIHFGLVCVFTMCLGTATPPFGTCIFTSCAVTGRPFFGVSREIVPFILVQLGMAFVFAFIPVLSTLLPSLMN